MHRQDKSNGVHVVRTLALFFFLLVWCGQARAAELRISLPQRLHVREGYFYLGEYAALVGETRLVAQASMLAIRPTGNTIRREQIIEAFAAGGLGGITLNAQIPPVIEIVPESPVAQHLRLLTGWAWRIDAQGVEYPEGVQIVTPERVLPGARNLTVYLLEGAERKNRHQVKLTWYQPTLIAARDLKKRVALTEGDFLIRIDKTEYMQKALTAPSEAVGASLRRSVRVGFPILEEDLLSEGGIKSGQRVSLIGRRGELAVTTQAIALQRGKVGDVIRVKNISSRKVLWARVISNNQVEISQEEK